MCLCQCIIDCCMPSFESKCICDICETLFTLLTVFSGPNVAMVESLKSKITVFCLRGLDPQKTGFSSCFSFDKTGSLQ